MRTIYYYCIYITLAFLAISSFAESQKKLKVYPVPEEGCMETEKKRCDESKNHFEDGYVFPNYCNVDGDCYKGRTCVDSFCTGDLSCYVACSDHLTRICDESKNIDGPYACRTKDDCYNGRACYRCDNNCENWESGQICNYPEVGYCSYYPSGDYGPCILDA